MIPTRLQATFLLVAGALHPVMASAQGGRRPPPEFTRQVMLIVNFAPGVGANIRIGKRAADAVRSRVARRVNRRDVEVVDRSDVDDVMSQSGYDTDSTYGLAEVHVMSRRFRADEFLRATVSSGPQGTRLSGELVMVRDERLRQPLPSVEAAKLDSAAELFAQGIVAARSQMVAQRRCENALQEGREARALAAAREGVVAYPRSTIARTCVVWSLRQMRAPSREVLSVADSVLAIDARSAHAIEAAAIALDTLGRTDEAASMWLRLAATDTANLDLAFRVTRALIDTRNAKRAEPFVARLAEAHAEELRFTQQLWRAAFENRNWTRAIAAGEILLSKDLEARADSTFHLRLGTAYRSAARPYEAVETLAHAVVMFPADARLYSLYSQAIKAEADTVVPRGLALFPRSADLLAISARELRARGKVAEALDLTKRAVQIDTNMSHGQLVVAQLEIELGRPDSALVALRRAIDSGDDSTSIAQFALAKGNALYRAAGVSQSSSDYAIAYRFLALADSVHASTQAQFLLGAAALGIAKTALTEATKLTDKVESCRLAHLGADMIPDAQRGLVAGREAYASLAAESLEYLAQLEPYARDQIKSFC